MKKVLFLALSLTVIFFASCSKDDDSTPSITGKWSALKMTSEVSTQDTTYLDTAYYVATSSIHFAKNGKVYTKLKQSDNDDVFEYDTSSYAVKGDLITVTEDDGDDSDTTIMQIDQLTNSSLILSLLEDIGNTNSSTKVSIFLTK